MADKRQYYAKDKISCYVKNLLTGTTIEFELIPESVTDSNSASFDPQDIRGRSTPIQGYNNSGPRTVSYTVILHDDYCKDGILKTVNALRALTYPAYGGSVTPPTCYVRFGKMIKMKAITNSVSVNWMTPYRDGVFTRAEVTLDFIEVRGSSLGASSVEGGKQ